MVFFCASTRRWGRRLHIHCHYFFEVISLPGGTPLHSGFRPCYNDPKITKRYDLSSCDIHPLADPLFREATVVMYDSKSPGERRQCNITLKCAKDVLCGRLQYCVQHVAVVSPLTVSPSHISGERHIFVLSLNPKNMLPKPEEGHRQHMMVLLTAKFAWPHCL